MLSPSSIRCCVILQLFYLICWGPACSPGHAVTFPVIAKQTQLHVHEVPFPKGFVNAHSQWKKLHYNVVSHWLGAYAKWSLYTTVLALKGNHEDVVTWEHFLHYWPFVRGIHMAVDSEVISIFGKSQNTQCSCLCKSHWFNTTLKHRQNGGQFADDIFKIDFFN